MDEPILYSTHVREQHAVGVTDRFVVKSYDIFSNRIMGLGVLRIQQEKAYEHFVSVSLASSVASS